MKNILIAIRSIFKKGRHNVMKIVSLGIGLAVGLVLIAKVYFEQSYDDFYPDRDRVYQVWAKYQQNGGELKDYPQTSGGIAPTMQQQIPEIETVTRYTSFGDWTFTMTDTKMKYSGRCIIADSCFFDILPRPMLIGNAKEVSFHPDVRVDIKSYSEKYRRRCYREKLHGRQFAGTYYDYWWRF